MRNLNQYKNRFNQLLESTLGNVKPLISEQTTGDTFSFGTEYKQDEYFNNKNFPLNLKNSKRKENMNHSVTQSDTLESISKMYGITVDEILKDNPNKTNDNLIPGETLCFQGYEPRM